VELYASNELQRCVLKPAQTPSHATLMASLLKLYTQNYDCVKSSIEAQKSTNYLLVSSQNNYLLNNVVMLITKRFLALLAFFIVFLQAVAQSQTTLIPYTSTWKYLDNGSDQGTAWRATTFNDATWASGPAELGYGDGDEATVVSNGLNPPTNTTNRHITTYFRQTINVVDVSTFGSYRINLVRDDGAVVYINGVERFRSNMPTGTITSTTLASSTIDGTAESAVNTIIIPASSLVNGTNVIAVEVHQRAAGSSDISFKLELIGLTSPTVSGLSPLDNTVGVSKSSNLSITFSETVQKGTGNILIKEGGITTQTIDVTSAAVTVAGNIVTIDPPADFTNSKEVRIEIPSTAFKDLDNNEFSGINIPTWNFTVETSATNGSQTLLAFGSEWKYLDNGSNQGTAWRATTFNDGTWANGNAELGYGDGGEATVVSFGSDNTMKHVTTYFRKTINIANPNAYAIYLGKVVRDDGVAVYINGTEVFRDNLDANAIFSEFANSAIGGSDESTPQTFTFSPSLLVAGDNVIAVEIHQSDASSSDISFNFELVGSNTPSLTRGPYLNMGNETAVTLRWRTDIATNTKVELGTTHGVYPTVFTDNVVTTEHEIRLTGLTPDTKYFYRFGSSTDVLQAGTDNFFVTAPPQNTTRKMRFAVFGDCGRDDNGYQTQTLAAYQNYLGANNGEIMILLGDNAYNNGTDAEYQSKFFGAYQGNILKNHVIMPAPGNHDYYSSNQTSRTGAYYQNFTMPTAAECGGVASGTEAFYSWDRGDVHFVSLDSYGKENPNATRLYDTLGTQVTWLKQDLAANTKKWTIVYWHHPPYTMGSHNSDTETELIKIRENLLRILERYGVDLVMCGHSHNYERSYLLKNYFGFEANFNIATHAKDGGSSGKYDGSPNSCAYQLPEGQVEHGIVYVVSGSAGASGGVEPGYPHNAMPWSFNDGGMLQLEIEGNRLDAKFVRRNQVIADQFTIMKGVKKKTSLDIPPGTSTTLSSSWIGNYNWSNGATTKTTSVSPTARTLYTVTDNLSCLVDSFYVNPVDTTLINASICVGQTYTFNNTTLSTAGTYTREIVKLDGGKGIEKLILVVNPLPAAPTASAQSFCGTATVANLVATGTALKWFDVATGGTELAATTALLSQNYYVSQTVDGCEGPRTLVAVTIKTIPAAPTASAQSFCGAATVANLVATGTALKWFDVATGGTELASTTALTSQNYYVSQTIDGCESPRTLVAVTIKTIPAAPTAAAQSFCGAATVANLVTTGTALKWFDVATGGTELASTTSLVSQNYYVSQTVDGCESPRTLVAVTIKTIPAAPTASAQSFCGTATVANLVATGTALKWFDVATGGTELASTASLVSQNYYVSQTVDGCESPRTLVTVTIKTIPAAPTAAAQSFCGAATVANLVATGTALKWFDVATGGTELASTTTLVSQNYYVSQTANGCEGPRTLVAVTIKTIPAAPIAAAQSFCGAATVANLVATGTALKWFDVATGGTELASTTALTSQNYYVSQTVDGCEGPRTLVAVTVNTSVPASPVVSNITYSINQMAIPLTAVGTNLLWYTSATGGTGTNVAPTPTTSVAGTFDFWVSQTIGLCESARSKITVTVNPGGPCASDDNLIITGTGGEIQDGKYYAKKSIITAIPVKTPGNVGLESGGSIQLNPGFVANNTTLFEAIIVKCN
jgi:3',5'-cyclic AMP phosphodiesterase CpdA